MDAINSEDLSLQIDAIVREVLAENKEISKIPNSPAASRRSRMHTPLQAEALRAMNDKIATNSRLIDEIKAQSSEFEEKLSQKAEEEVSRWQH